MSETEVKTVKPTGTLLGLKPTWWVVIGACLVVSYPMIMGDMPVADWKDTIVYLIGIGASKSAVVEGLIGLKNGGK